MTHLPLAGLRIISFEQYGAAPYCTMFLADFGAEVIKVEGVDGDYARQTGPKTLGEADSLYYQCFNLNKRSLILDLKSPDDRELFHALVRDSDAVVNNIRGSLPAKLGIDYAALKAVNPAIVCGHISAYGRTGSRADWPGYDFLMQAEAGIMSLTGEPGAPPARVGLSMIDYMTGMMMAFGLVSAIRKAERTREGCDVDVSLFDTALHQLAYQGTWYLNEGLETERVARSAHPSSVPVQLYPSADGWIYICCMNQKFWEILLEITGQQALGQDPRFAQMADRTAHRDVLTALLDPVFRQKTNAEWMALLKGKIPAAPVEQLSAAIDNPFVAESGMVREVPHERSGRMLRMFANPLRLDGQRLNQAAAPGLDADGPALREEYQASAVVNRG
jgi:crotonobetainyl-CoA:carnitine CoA-transferase CaiB-like acyl-CoA transferase